MRKLICLIPFLFWGIQPYNQINESEHKEVDNDITFSIETDTMILSFVIEKSKEEVKELEELENYKKRLNSELTVLKRRENIQDKLLKNLEKDIENFENYKNRGL